MERRSTTPAEWECRAGAIWATEYRMDRKQDGRTIHDHKFRIQRHYMGPDGQWATTTYFRTEDLPKLIVVAIAAYQRAVLREPAFQSTAALNGRNHDRSATYGGKDPDNSQPKTRECTGDETT